MATQALSTALPDVRTEFFGGHAHTAHSADPALVADSVRTLLAASPA